MHRRAPGWYTESPIFFERATDLSRGRIETAVREHCLSSDPINMKKFFAHLLCLSLLLAGAAANFAQQSKPQKTAQPAVTDLGQEKPEVINVRRVRLPITVTDKKGQLVIGLTQSDFLILEDKVPQQIDSFTSEENNNLPLYVGVLMDTSPSTAGKLKFEQESAMNFIQTVVRPRKDRVLFATFDDQVTLRQDFTDRLELLDRAVFAVKATGKQTALYDAIWQFCDEKMRSAQGRRSLVIITDGDDTYSRADINDAIDIAQRTETTIFAISTKAGLSGSVPGVEAGTIKDRGDKGLERLCDETGGAAFFTGDMLALERSFTKIARELRSQYLITYKSTNNAYDGSYRRVEVRLGSGHDNLRPRTKRGYKAVSDSVTAK
ncbi:MAG: Ca-activated chloride channel [Blastocatellia bacterium]|jgi:VWFA-related protein|nr:Ca-activated chloride channel [Blastocatellia bacterium]